MAHREAERHSLGLHTTGFGALLVTQFLGALNVFGFLFFLVTAINEYAGPDVAVAARRESLAYFLAALPFVLLAGWAGAVTDRYRKSSVMRASKLVEIAVMGGAVAACVLERGDWMYALMFLLGAQAAFFMPARHAYLAETVAEAELTRANALSGMLTFVALIAGHVGGSFLYGRFSDDLALGCSAFVVIALAGAAASWLVPNSETAHAGGGLLNPVPMLLRTWREVSANRGLLYTVLGIGNFYLMAALLDVELRGYAAQVLGAGETLAHTYVALAVLGVAAGALLAARWSEGKVELGVVPLGALLWCLALWTLSLLPTPPHELGVAGGLARLLAWTPACIAALVLGVAGGLVIVPLAANLQVLAPEAARGRFVAFGNMLAFLGVFLSASVVWLLGELHLDARGQLVAAAVLMLVGTGVSIWLLPEAFLRLLGWLLAHTIYSIRLLHAERIPAKGGALLVANHVSWVDWLVIAATTRRRVRFLIQREYFQWRAVSWLFKLAHCVPVASGDAPEVQAASLAEAARQIEEGHLVVIFAEGSITRTGHMQSIRRGYQRIVQERGIAIIPVHLDGLWGSVFSHEGGGLLRKLPRRIPYPVTVTYGDPLPPRAEPWQLRAALARLSTEAWIDRRQRRLPLHVALLRERRRSRAPALFEAGRPALSRAALIARALALRDALRPRLGQGRYVGILLPQGQDAVVASVAVLCAGRVPVPLNTTLDSRALQDQLRRAGIESVVTTEALRARAEVGAVAHCLDAEPFAGDGARQRARYWRWMGWLLPWPLYQLVAIDGNTTDLDAPCVLLYSAGSTGPPKAVELTHHNVLSNVESVQEVVDLGDDDRILGMLPPFMAAGWVQSLWRPLLTAPGVVFAPDPTDGKAIGQAVARDRVTVMFATPRLLERYLRQVRPDRFGSLRLVFSAGEKLLPMLRVAFEERFGLAPLEAYSSTECSSLVALNTLDVRGPGLFQRGARHGTVGHALPGVTVEVVDPPSGELMPNDQPGMLRVKGPGVFPGYLDDPHRNQLVLRDGYYVSGDMAVLDDDGFITLTGRYARVSRIGTERVSHAAIEEAIAYQLGAADNPVAVIGYPDGSGGEALWVFYQRGSLQPEHLLAGLTARGLSQPWLPRLEHFRAVDEIPLLPTGTVDYRALERVLGGEGDGADGQPGEASPRHDGMPPSGAP